MHWYKFFALAGNKMEENEDELYIYLEVVTVIT